VHQLAQELKHVYFYSHKLFTYWIIKNCEIGAKFSSKIIFSDEVHFKLNGLVKKQNCQI